MESFSDIESGAFQLNKIVEKFGESPAIVTAEGVIRYREFFQRIAETAAELRRQKVKPGERVAIIGPNSGEYLILLMALWQIGAVAVVLNTRFPEDQISFLLKKIDCPKLVLLEKSLVLDSRFSILYIRFPNLLPDFKSEITKSEILEGFHPGNCLDDNALAGNPITKSLNHQKPATLIFTSGSSGEPKAALHSFGNHIYNALGSNLNIPFGPGNRWLLSLPLYHVGGLAILFRALVNGGAVVVADENMPLLEAIRKLEITHVSLVATQLYRLLKEVNSGETFSNVKAILLGGGAFPPSLIRAAIERGLPIHTSYGSTEMGSQITTTPPGASVEKLVTSGKVLKYRELKIAADGEILVRGETRFRGYWEGNSLTQPFDTEDWFPTGDIGKLDDDGYLTVLGRKDNMFISGGENIQPEEIEMQLCQMPGIEQAIVVPVKNKEFGMRPVAFIKIQPGDPINETAIRNFLRTRIAHFKIPDHFFPWPEATPKSGIKINRKYFQTIAKELTGEKINRF